ncbi:MAG: adenylosuccinate lyase, partial [Acutalibacteraceae bacterium]|nr:adenylosuccinate lyase [Acutalibacteraceae bacterium]
DRQELHEKIRQYSMEAGRNVKVEGKDNNLAELIANDKSFGLSIDEINAVMKPANFVGRSPQQVEDFINEVISPILEENKELLGIEVEINV